MVFSGEEFGPSPLLLCGDGGRWGLGLLAAMDPYLGRKRLALEPDVCEKLRVVMDLGSDCRGLSISVGDKGLR